MIENGTPDQVMKSADPEVRQFLDAEPDGPVPFHYPASDYQEQLIGTRR